MTHVDASLVQQIFDIPKRERETGVQYHCKADELETRFEVLEVLEVLGFEHGQKLRNRSAPLNQSSSDKTVWKFQQRRISGLSKPMWSP
ncbi:hypothetical protein [Ruegeria profundi]|uniref:hypothetical protein n=1 Tax=Ruegeria profundi TaxID=1685378 RepID=UPI003C7C7437